MKRILVFAIGLLMVAGISFGAVSSRQPVNMGGVQMIGYVTPSLTAAGAGALDTLEVGPINIAGYWNAGVADTVGYAFYSIVSLAFEGQTGTGGSGTVDSLDVGFDVSYDGQNWTQHTALATGAGRATGAAPLEEFVIKAKATSSVGLKGVPVYLRFRLDNLGAATGKAAISVSWPTN